MNKRSPRLRVRRGATMVLVAVMLLVCAGMAAFAIDLARVYTGVNEMQTGADASALMAGHRLMRTGVSPVSATQTFAAQNNALGTALSLNAADIEAIIWNPGTGNYSSAGSWGAANGVRVTMRRTTRLPFGGLIGPSTLNPTRTAIAWIANQNARDCIQPWGIETTYMNTLLGGGRTITSQAGVAYLSSEVTTVAGQRRQTLVARPDGTLTGTNAAPTTFGAMTGSSSGISNYVDELSGSECDGSTNHVAGREERVNPGNGGGDVPKKTRDGIEDSVAPRRPTCRIQGAGGSNVNDATCYNPATGAAGVDVVVAAVTPQAGNPANRINVDAFVSFKLMCVFRGQGNGNSRSAEWCPFLTGNVPDNDYMQGTIVGYAMPGVAILGGGNTIGTAISSAQKLVLVR